MSVEQKANDVSSVDAYKTLGLHPRASRDLVEAAYWALVTYVEDDLSQLKVGVAPRLRALNDCYAMLNEPERRTAYDAAHGLDKRYRKPLVALGRSGLFRGRKPYVQKANYYEILHTDLTADPVVIDRAYEVRRRQLRGRGTAASLEMSLVERAFVTLKDPEARLQYDRKMKFFEAPSEPSIAPAVPETPHQLRASVETPTITPSNEAAQALATPPEQDAENLQGRPRFPLLRVLRGPARSNRVVTSGTGDGERRIKSLSEPEDSKLAERAQLRDLGLIEARIVRDRAIDDEEPAAPARFVFTGGPLAGRSVGLIEGSLIFGSSETADVVLPATDGTIGAGHARVWCRDAEYILHQLDTFTTTYVNGERLSLRLVILEPGDEIAIGPHTLRFERVPVPAT